ncbi:MAG: cation:proton antiporter domain-containing protein [Bacteroidales bacterium]
MMFPLTDPVAVFAVLIAVIFFSPFLFRLVRIPDVAAFIIAGIIMGPYGLNILMRDPAIELLETAGLLYIMFLIGLELDSEKLRQSKWHSLLFGILTFSFPFIIGILVSRSLLHQDQYSSLFISMMLASHTLVAYPTVRKLGLTGDAAVVTAIGGTIITDTLVLILLSFLLQTNGEPLHPGSTLILIPAFIGFLIVVFAGYPRLSRWFFNNVKKDRPVHFIFIIMLVGASSLVAELLGFEAIIGAFLAGMALSRSVPRNSMLMHHIDFVGNILFIPVFLIGIGMLINIRILFTEASIWSTFLVLTIAALLSKWLAAFFTQKVMGFNSSQRDLIFGLTGPRAATAIAVMLIGYERSIIPENLLDTTVRIILISCLVGSLLVDRTGKKLAVKLRVEEGTKEGNSMLVPIANPSTMAPLVQLAIGMQDKLHHWPIYLLSIIHDDRSSRENMARIRNLLESNISEFNNLSDSVRVITRVDLSVSGGIIRAAKEYMTSEILVGWGGMKATSSRILGSVFDQLYKETQVLYVCNVTETPEEIETMRFLLPDLIDHEKSFDLIMDRISRLPIKSGGLIEIYASGEVSKHTTSMIRGRRKVKTVVRSMAGSFHIPSEDASREILHIMFLPRKHTVSYDPGYNHFIRKQIPLIEHGNFILIVPGWEIG